MSTSNTPLSRRFVLAGGLLGFAGLPRALAAQPPAAPQPIPLVLRATQATVRLAGGDGPPTLPAGFEGRVPGPTIHARQGQEIRVRLVNALDTPVSLHWHGVRLANAMSGVAHLIQPPVAPGGSFDYRFAPPDAGTFWYR